MEKPQNISWIRLVLLYASQFSLVIFWIEVKGLGRSLNGAEKFPHMVQNVIGFRDELFDKSESFEIRATLKKCNTR